MYHIGANLGELHVPYDSTGIPIELRVGRHLAAVTKIINIFSQYNPGRAVVFKNIPDFDQLMEKGLGAYFK